MSTDKMLTDIMSNRQNVEQTKFRTYKMSTDKMTNRQNDEQTEKFHQTNRKFGEKEENGERTEFRNLKIQK